MVAAATATEALDGSASGQWQGAGAALQRSGLPAGYRVGVFARVQPLSADYWVCREQNGRWI